ncbi:MAG: hypothetical protein LBR39_02345 [Coriobacteriales bacterium]|nr:hypothetical protein [Coriobacteriales bacterium]
MREVHYVKWRDPNDELNGLARWVQHQLNTDEELLGADVCFVMPNRTWAKVGARALKERKLASTTLWDGPGLSIPEQDPGRNPAYVAWLKLRLLAEANGVEDGEVWQLWRSLADAEQQAQQEQQGRDFVAVNARKQGFGLIKAIAGEEPDEQFRHLIDPVDGDEDVRTLLARVNGHIAQPQFLTSESAVRICSYGRLGAQRFRVLILPGLVEGLLPSPLLADDTAQLTRLTEQFGTALSNGTQCLLLSSFQMVEKKRGISLGLSFTRTRDVHGQLMGMLSPSRLLIEAGDAIPPSTSGQQFLEQAGI